MGFANLYSMAEQAVKPVTEQEGYSYVWAVVLTGLSVVFLGLIILIFFVWLMGKIFTIGKNKKNVPQKAQSAAKQAETPKVPPKAAPVTASSDNDEIIAVISAAVAAMGQAEGKNYRVRSVRAAGKSNRASRSAWAMAGLQNNTRPF